ncbi:MAG: hypothetical protein M3O61_15810 [Gemmatimonadota bacterium]|nr:hypothetical protein [Gemmatimonadota bacterium]
MKKLLPSALLLIAGICLAIGLAEGLVRIFAPHSRDHVVPAGMFEIDSELGWKLHPGKQVRHHTRYFNVAYSINSMGFRDRPRTAANANAKRRVLFFGDSEIFGWGVSPDQGVSGLVEAHSPSIEVWNMGVPGYGLDQEILSYEMTGRALGATDVIFHVSVHTLARSTSGFIFRKPKPRFVVDSIGRLLRVPVQEKSTAGTDLVYRVLSQLYLPYFVETQVKDLTRRAPKRPRGLVETVAVNPTTMRLGMALLLKARTIAAERNQRMFVLASLPDTSRKQLKDFCDRNGIVLVETPWPVPPRQFSFGTYDGHWNPRGHQLVADRLSAQLER